MSEPTPVRPVAAVLVAVVLAVLAYVLLRRWVDAGHAFPHPSWLELAALLLIACTTLVLGRRVRRMARGLEGPWVSALTAARTFVLAQAAVVTGAALAGIHAAACLLLAQVASETGVWGGLARSVVLTVAGTTLAVVGLVVQGWCRRPPEDDRGAPADDG